MANDNTGIDPTGAELECIEALLRPLVTGARAVVAPAHPDPRRVLATVDHPDYWGGWGGLTASDRRLLLWHGCAEVLTRLCAGHGGTGGAPRAVT